MTRRAVFLDRDGILVRTEVKDGKPYAPRTLADFSLLPDAAPSCLALKRAGFALIVVTNQPDVGNGLVERSVVEAMHAQFRAALPLDSIKTCYHAQHEGCGCRKPEPGLLLEAAAEFDLNLGASFMIGDRWLDIAAGRRAGCYAILVDRGYAESVTVPPDATVGTLEGAVQVVLRQGACC